MWSYVEVVETEIQFRVSAASGHFSGDLKGRGPGPYQRDIFLNQRVPRAECRSKMEEISLASIKEEHLDTLLWALRRAVDVLELFHNTDEVMRILHAGGMKYNAEGHLVYLDATSASRAEVRDGLSL